MNNEIIPEIVDTIKYLAPNLQRQVLAYVQNLKRAHKPGGGGKSLLDFAGSIPEKDLKIMSEAIEKDLGRIDPNEW